MSTFSTTGGRPAMHTGIDRLTVDQNPAYTDWQALGLPDHSPFDILSRPRAVPNLKAKAPQKRGPRKTRLQKVLATLNNRQNTAFNTDILSKKECDRTNAIAGRGFA